MNHVQGTPRRTAFADSDNESATTLTRVSRTTREHGEVLCDHCGRTAPRAEMAVDADPESESGWVCAEGHGCAGPRPERVSIAGQALPVAALLSPDAAARLGAVVEADLILAGAPVDAGAMTPRERKALRKELRARVERESLRLVAVSREASGDAVKRQTEQVLRVGRALARYLSAAKRRRQVKP